MAGGRRKASESGIVVSIILGAITAVGGGAVRDICVGEIPAVFQRSNYYAVAGLGGAAVYVALAQLGCPLPVAGVLCVATVVGLRYASVSSESTPAKKTGGSASCAARAAMAPRPTTTPRWCGIFTTAPARRRWCLIMERGS